MRLVRSGGALLPSEGPWWSHGVRVCLLGAPSRGGMGFDLAEHAPFKVCRVGWAQAGKQGELSGEGTSTFQEVLGVTREVVME